MTKRDDFLVEIFTEELPPKSLVKLADVFAKQIAERLNKADLAFEEVKYFATPRRLAVFVKKLAATQPTQTVERRGPAKNAAFQVNGEPTPALMGFARSCGVSPAELVTIKTDQGEWLGYTQTVPGKSTLELLPTIVEQAALALPIPKRMRWGDNDVQFARPIHSVVMLYGEQVVAGNILGCAAGRVTRGHRFHAPAELSIPKASDYEALLQKAFVIADFDKRRQQVREQAEAAVKRINVAAVLAPNRFDELLDEVTGLVEWPVALSGHFDEVFLKLPSEILISSMQDHQRYFPVMQHEKLLPYFVMISNIESHDRERVLHGNERVLRARLSDAAFFYDVDQQETLFSRLERLKGIVYQAKLGTLHDKAERLSKLSAFIAPSYKDMAERAGWLAKTDLTTQMVGEFPELQGVMGCYYASHDNEPKEVAIAMKEQYMPRFANDELPLHPLGMALALADRMDVLTGAFGIKQIPTGDKDPYGLRRAALGLIRICMNKENPFEVNLQKAFEFAVNCYQVKLENTETVAQILNFIQERLRAWYQEQQVSADVFAAVAALGVVNLGDVHRRIQAVQAFKRLTEAEALSVANKRVSNILAKYTDTIAADRVNPDYFEHPAEKVLAQQLADKNREIEGSYQQQDYEKVLLSLAELRQPIDDFFDHVMVMSDDKSKRENRILLLRQLRMLFTKVADIALLQ